MVGLLKRRKRAEAPKAEELDEAEDRRRKNRRVRRESEPPPPPEAPKPTLRERWGAGWEAKKERGRALLARLRRPALWIGRLLLVLLVGATAVAVGRLIERHVRTSEAFAVRSLEVEGHVRLSEEELLRAAGLEVGQNVFERSPEEVRERLRAHPWVASATVRRRLPGSFEITVRERTAAALLALGPLYLISADGTVFKRLEEGDPTDLPVVTGVDAARFTADRAYRASLLLEIVALLHDYRGAGLFRREPISEVHVEPDDGLSLYVGDDATYVRLGQGPFRPKLQRLRRVLDELGRRHTRAAYVYLDNVRRPDRVTVRVRGTL